MQGQKEVGTRIREKRKLVKFTDGRYLGEKIPGKRDQKQVVSWGKQIALNDVALDGLYRKSSQEVGQSRSPEYGLKIWESGKKREINDEIGGGRGIFCS